MEHECKGTVHKVVAGDTLYKLSKLYGVRLIDILKENPYVNIYIMGVCTDVCCQACFFTVCDHGAAPVLEIVHMGIFTTGRFEFSWNTDDIYIDFVWTTDRTGHGNIYV